MATSRRIGTNEVISTFGGIGQGRDYTSLQTWESATDNDLVTLQVSETLECFADEASYDQTCSFGGTTTNASFFRMIRAESGSRHLGVPNTGVLFDSSANAVMMDFSTEGFFTFQDIELSRTLDTTSFRVCVRARGTDHKMIGCLWHDSINIGSGSAGPISWVSPNDNHLLVNCAMVNMDGDAYNQSVGGVQTWMFNCVILDCLTGIRPQGSGCTITCKNVISDGHASFDDFRASSGDYLNSTNCASGDPSAPGANPRINQTFDFVNRAGSDVHLALTDGGARNFGFDLSAEAFYDFDDDVNFNLYDTWDIGFDEPEPAGAPTASFTTVWHSQKGVN